LIVAGVGYHLTIVFANHIETQQKHNAVTASVLSLLQQYCPDAEIRSSINNESTFLLPDTQRHRYPISQLHN